MASLRLAFAIASIEEKAGAPASSLSEPRQLETQPGFEDERSVNVQQQEPSPERVIEPLPFEFDEVLVWQTIACKGNLITNLSCWR